MTDSGEKLRALVLAALMVFSVFGATVAFSGAAAAASNAGFSVGNTAAGATTTLTSSITAGSTVGGSSLQAVTVDFSPASDFDGGFSNTGAGDVTVRIDTNGDGTFDTTYSGSSDISVSKSNGDKTIKVEFDSTSVVDGSGVEVDTGNFQNPSSDGNYRGTIDLNPPSSGGQDAADLTIGGATSPTGPTVYLSESEASGTSDTSYGTVGDAFYANIEGVDPGDSVMFEHVVEGSVVNSVSKSVPSDGSTQTLSAEFSAAKEGTVRFYQNGVQIKTDDYTTANYQVNVLNDVLFGTTSDVRGEILKYNGTEKILADGTNIDYELYDPSGSSIAEGDTDNGKFLITRTFNFKPNANDNSERNTDLDYPSDDGSAPAYIVYVQEDPTNSNPGAGPMSNDGTETVNVRLNVTGNIDSGVVYGDTSDVTGSILDGEDNGVANYKFQVRDTEDDPAVDAGDGSDKERSSTTAQNGDFGFTMVFNDAGTWAYGTDVGGITSGNENVFIQYGTFSVDTAQGNLTITGQPGNQQSFPSDFTVEANDQNGDDLDLTAPNFDGYVALVGEFETTRTDLADDGDVIETVAAGDLSGFSTSGTFVRAADLDDDGQVDQIHIVPESDGTMDVTVTPLSGTINAELQSQFSVSGDEIDTLAEGVEETTLNTPDTPDIAASDSVAIGNADPINVLNLEVRDPQVDNDFTDNDFTNDGLSSPDYSLISEDAAPNVVEVLPHAQSPARANESVDNGDRIANGIRLGRDTNSDIEGITQYQFNFELVDESGSDMVPGTESGEIETLELNGAGINATITATEDSSGNFDGFDINDNSEVGGVIVSKVSYDAGTGTYTVTVLPTEATSTDEQITIDITEGGDTGNTAQITKDASGLQISSFQVDGETVSEVEGQTTVNVTAVVQNPAGEFINNGRVRINQDGQGEIANIDARTTDRNINDGEYRFSNVEIGPRGVDTDGDGIGERVADLTFTAYQYTDADADQTVEQNEVTRATIENLELVIDENLQIEYLPNQTSTYSGYGADGNFTLTRGVEYGQIAFNLTDEGEPVDLTEGIGGVEVGLNELVAEDLITLTGPGGTDLDVRLDPDESDPANGTYVISDVESAENVTSQGTSLNDGDTFLFYSPDADANGAPDEDTGPNTYDLSIETANRSRATASDTGQFTVDDPQVEGTVVGVTSESINGTSFGELAHDQTDTEFNETSGTIETLTIGTERTYRVNATATDALGTPLNGSATSPDRELVVTYTGGDADDSTAVNRYTNDYANFEMVEGGTSFDAVNGVSPEEVFPTPGGSASNEGKNTVVVTNANGTFQYDIQPNQAVDDGRFQPLFAVEYKQETFTDADGNTESIDASGTPVPLTGAGHVSAGPNAAIPLVNVFDENGGRLPTASDTGNLVLAKDITNRLRIEAFPADPDDFPLGDGLRFGFTGPFSEDDAETTTQSADSFENTQIATDGFDEAQIGFLTLTPTGTGDGVIQLRSDTDDSGGITEAADDVAVNTDGDNIVFDVQRSNRQLDLEQSPTSPTQGQNVTFTLTDASTGEPVETVTVIISSPAGETTTLLTDANGTAELNGSFVDETGEFTVSTRRAGFAPLETSFRVTGPGLPEVGITGATLEPNEVNDNQTVTHTLTLDVTNVSDDGDTDTFTVNFPSAVENISPNSVSVEDAEGDTVAVTGADTSGTLYTFSVSPDSSVEARDLTATVSVDVTFPDVDSNTTLNITASVSDSRFGSDAADVPVTILNVTEEEPEPEPEAPDPDGDGTPAQDPDNDGVYEDVNGDGQVLPGDATVLFNLVFDGTIASDNAQFDINGDGQTLPGDATVLFNEAFES